MRAVRTSPLALSNVAEAKASSNPSSCAIVSCRSATEPSSKRHRPLYSICARRQPRCGCSHLWPASACRSLVLTAAGKQAGSNFPTKPGCSAAKSTYNINQERAYRVHVLGKFPGCVPTCGDKSFNSGPCCDFRCCANNNSSGTASRKSLHLLPVAQSLRRFATEAAGHH